MGSLINKQSIRALLITMLLSAFLHLGLAYSYFVRTLDFEVLNLFTILGFEYYFPGITYGFANMVWSYFAFLVVYLIVLVALGKLSKKKDDPVSDRV